MNRKIAALIIVSIFALCCAGIAFAGNESSDALDSSDDSGSVELEDTSNYIAITGIANGEIKFADGFTGYAMDSSKGKIGSDATFTPGEFSHSKIENYIKLAIIEAYKQGKENQLGAIISKIADNNMDSSDSVISEVLNSNDNIGSSEVVKINDNTEATFTFELLKSTDDEKSDCLAYKVSMKTVESDKLAASDDVDNTSEDNKQDTTGNDNNDDKAEDTNKNKTTNDKNDSETTNNEDVKKESEKNNAEKENPKNNTTIVKTTTTVIENNTTIVHNNVKEVNNTTEPKNDTAGNLLKAGNPILILIIVVVVAVIAVVIMKRKN
ncbi:MAG: hypothetical protein Q4Q37_04960 [Methanobrevibacter sp.]|nr:hypothetical protein [Methanobrevibacter sp.]